MAIEEANIGVLLDSLASAVTAYTILRFAKPGDTYEREETAQAAEILADGDVESMERR